MSRPLPFVSLTLLLLGFLLAEADGAGGSTTIHYGANAAAGRTFVHDGVKLYYEIYGSGEPLLVVHGNGGSIADLAAQIAHFGARYQVIAMDSRDQGRSGDSADALTYEKMTDDLAALLHHLNTGPTNVLGWSDGGIQALLLGIRYPKRVKKIVAMAANLNPTADAIHPDVLAWMASYVDETPAGDTPQDRRARKVAEIMLDQPQIDPQALESISAPTLIMAGDRDMIRDEHTIEIYHHIPNGQLAIAPNTTHMYPFDDPQLFNATVERFLATPFVKRDRIADFETSLERLRPSH